VIVHVPTTITLGVSDGGGQFDVPVGTVFSVQLESHGCGPPQWQAPAVDPPSVIRGVSGGDLTSGIVATGSFVIVGPGDATITAAGSCVGLPIGACEVVVWRVNIHARTVATPISLPRTD
jgi:hypothetical protein